MRRGSAFAFTILALGIACLPPATAPARQVPEFDMKVLGTTVFGLQVGMSPRRVLLDIQKNNWTYSQTARNTIEDIIEQNPSMSTIYLELPPKKETGILGNLGISGTNSLAVSFGWDSYYTKRNRVTSICHTESKSATEYEAVVAAAKAHLTALGGFEESITDRVQFEHRLTYKKVDRNEIRYQIIRFHEAPTRLLVYYTVQSY